MDIRRIVWAAAASVLVARGGLAAGLAPPREWEIPQLVAQAGDEASGAGAEKKQSEGEAAPGGYTPEQIAKMIANPLGYLWLLNIQNTTTWYNGSATQAANQDLKAQNTLLLQPVLSMQFTPGVRLITRPIVPINSFELPSNFNSLTNSTQPSSGQVTFERTTGLCDITWQNFFSTNEGVKPPTILGAGFALVMPTASSEVLGTGKWSAGPSAVALHMGDKWIYGVVATHIWSFAGDPDRNSINLTSLQPIIRYAVGKESHIGMLPNWNYNWETHQWAQLPLGLGFDTMLKIGPAPVQFGMEVYYNVKQYDPISPQWFLRFWFTPVIPAPAWAGKPLFGRLSRHR